MEKPSRVGFRWRLDFQLGEMAAIARGVVLRGDPARRVPGLVHDTREDVRGAMFVAIVGQNFDGHNYIGQAAERGAIGTLASREIDLETLPADFSVVRVKDTLESLGRLACARRIRFAGPVVAIAGSSGKTTTKEMIAHLLEARYKVLKTPGNWNNLIGLPLSLLELSGDCDIAVLELGMNRPGELQTLTRIAAPTMGVLTNVGLAHLGMFGNETELLNAKGEFVRNLTSAVTLFINADCERSALVVRELRRGGRLIKVGQAPGADYRILRITPEARGYGFDLKTPAGLLPLRLDGFGRFNVANAATAAAVASELGVSAETIGARLSAFAPLELRSQVLEADGVKIVADCYNASPDSTFAALESLFEMSVAGRRFAVLGDMLELGDAAEALHARIGRAFAQGGRRPADPGQAGRVELLITTGDLMRTANAAATEAGQRTAHAESAEEIVELLMGTLRAGDVVLIKGSRLMRLERVVEALERRLREGR